MKTLMGGSTNGVSELQGLANQHTDGDLQELANTLNNFLVSVSSDMPKLTPDHHNIPDYGPTPS